MTKYIFCDEDIGNYEKTVAALALSYSNAPLFSLTDENVEELAFALKVEKQLLQKALLNTERMLSYNTDIAFGLTSIKGSELMDSTFFAAIIRLYYAQKNFDELKDGTTIDILKHNVELFLSIMHEFEMINATLATAECMLHNQFSFDYTLFDSSEFNPMHLVDMLRTYLCCGTQTICRDFPLLLISAILRYELSVRFNALQLVLATQIIKHSPFFENETKNVADELYDHLLFMLKNGRVISVQTNLLHVGHPEHPQYRSRADNTTRMQIIYGYMNFDTYLLRLDLAHKGEGVVHWNNKTPGGVKCCLFSEQEMRIIIEQYPCMVSSFIEYGRKWALKERSNCTLSEEEWSIYENIRQAKEHEAIFQGSDEIAVVDFIDTMSRLLPADSYVAIDREEIHARYCFNLDKIMCFVYLLYLANIGIPRNTDTIQEIISGIVCMAVKYELIIENEKDLYMNEEGICLIASLAQERLKMCTLVK